MNKPAIIITRTKPPVKSYQEVKNSMQNSLYLPGKVAHSACRRSFSGGTPRFAEAFLER